MPVFSVFNQNCVVFVRGVNFSCAGCKDGFRMMDGLQNDGWQKVKSGRRGRFFC